MKKCVDTNSIVVIIRIMYLHDIAMCYTDENRNWKTRITALKLLFRYMYESNAVGRTVSKTLWLFGVY